MCSKRFHLSVLVQLSPLWTSYLLSPHPVCGFHLQKPCQCQQDDAATKYHVWQTPVCTHIVLLRTLPHGHVYHIIIMVIYRDNNPKWFVNAVLQIGVLWSCRWNHGLRVVFPDIPWSYSLSTKVEVSLDWALPQYAFQKFNHFITTYPHQ